MFSVILVLQIIVCAMSLIFTMLLLNQRGSLDNKLLFVGSLCVDLYSFGYIQEMLCKSAEEARHAFAFEYLGLAFAALCFSLFVFRYCHVKVPKIVSRILLCYCAFIMICVQMGEYNTIYYTSFDFVNEGIFPHVKAGHGVLYFSFVAFEAIMLILAMVAIMTYRKKVVEKSEKSRLLQLFIEALGCLTGIFATSFIPLGGWDPSPLILSALVVSITITLKKGHFYDTITQAMESMFHNVDTALIVVGASKKYLESNIKAVEMFPELKDWEMGRSMDDFCANVFASTAPVYFEQNDRYYKSTYSELMEKDHLIGYTITITDITDMRKQMEEMRVLKEEADIANESKSAFLANMSHEIRTPLNAIIGMAEISEREKSESVVKEYVSQIKSAGQMLLGIVSDVLDFSKAESGKLELVPVEFNTAEFLNSVINVTNMRIGDKPIDFLVDIDPAMPKKLYADDVHLRQILMNLLSNAEKFTARGYVKLKLDFEKDGRSMILKGLVEDTGMGIREKDKDKLFTAFKQIDEKRNRKIEGSGLGLAIYSQLVTLMGGTHKLESDYGKGSSFSFEVRLDIADEAPISTMERVEFRVPKVSTFYIYGAGRPDVKPVVENDIPDYSAYSILVVDDNRVNVKVLAAFLKHFNVEADVAYSGAEALEMVKNKEYSLIFMDHMMPEMDGVDTTKAIRSNGNPYYETAPIIACTANVVKGVERLFYEAGMNDLVPKPIQLSTLKEKMALYLK